MELVLFESAEGHILIYSNDIEFIRIDPIEGITVASDIVNSNGDNIPIILEGSYVNDSDIGDNNSYPSDEDSATFTFDLMKRWDRFESKKVRVASLSYSYNYEWEDDDGEWMNEEYSNILFSICPLDHQVVVKFFRCDTDYLPFRHNTYGKAIIC